MTIDIDLPATLYPPPQGKPRQLLTELPQPGHYLLSVDNSTLEGYQRCPTYTLYNLVYRRQAHARNAALTMGGAIHRGIELQLLGEPPEVQDRAILDYFSANPAPLDEYRTPTLAIQIMRHYRERSAEPDYSLQVLGDPPIIERPFELPLGVIEVCTHLRLPDWQHPRFVKAIHVAWMGRIDVIAHILHGNRVVDHKTTSIAGETYSTGFILSHQTIGYTWAARQLYPQLDIKGICINAIHMKRPANGQTPTNLTARGPKGGEPPLNFFRLHFDYTEDRCQEWAVNCMAIIEDMVHCLVRNFYPMHTHSCVNKYGRCQFHDVCCLENTTARHQMLTSDDLFEPVTWSPLLP